MQASTGLTGKARHTSREERGEEYRHERGGLKLAAQSLLSLGVKRAAQSLPSLCPVSESSELELTRRRHAVVERWQGLNRPLLWQQTACKY
jgi:hypothetical protein